MTQFSVTIFLMKLDYSRRYSPTAPENFVVFQNPGWNFPKTLGGIFQTPGLTQALGWIYMCCYIWDKYPRFGALTLC